MKTAEPAADRLHAAMVEAILRTGSACDSRLEQALRAVPRHAFVPQATPEEAYDPDLAVITKRSADGRALSCASVPTLVASMLKQLQVRPGDQVFECGAGTGYNAALLACLAGPDGQVTTVDIDPEVVGQAAHALSLTGYGGVRVVTGDGSLGAPVGAPYDRSIITAGAWDLPPAWWEQLRPGGRLVVPLRWRGQTRSVAFVLGGDGVFRSDSVRLCGFVPMEGQDGERTATIDRDEMVSLYWDADQPISPTALSGALTTPKAQAWSAVTVGPQDPFDGVWLRATATDPAICRIAVGQTAIESGLCTPAIATRSPALAEGESLAYFMFRREEQGPAPRRARLGAIGHGPRGHELAERLCGHIEAWDRHRDAQPVITAYRTASPACPARGFPVIAKEHCLLTITY